MATLTWNGGTGDWYDPNQWTSTGGTPNYPEPGDTAIVGSGEVDLVGSEAKDNGTFDADAVTLGTLNGSGTVLRAEDAILNHFLSITLAGSAEIVAQGHSVLQGPVTDAVAGSTLTLASTPDASGASTLDLQNGFSLSLGANTTLDLEGNIAVEATAGFATPNTASVTNNATVTQVGVRDTISGALTGTGTWNLKFGTTLALGGSVGSGQTIAFGGIDGRLILSEAADANGNITGFAGTVTGFASGNLIDFSTVGYNAGDQASYNAATQTLTLTDSNGKPLAKLSHVSAQAGMLQAVSDGSGGTLVEYAGTGTRLSYQIAGADKAMGSDAVRRSLTVPGTATPITGAGVKVGIISDSFNIDGQANADAMAGYLPSDGVGNSAVKVLQEGKSGDEDEGRAMAELVHQVAPGAAIDFCSVGNTSRSQSSMASAIQQLQADGCKVIVDDWTFFGAPMYQVGGPLDAGVNAALAAGVDYFTSAGNYGDSFLQQTFNPQTETLYGGTTAQSHLFSNGTPYENVTVSANSNAEIDLQWTAPYEGLNNAGAPDALTFKVFNSSGNFVKTSTQDYENGIATTDIYAYFTNSNSTAQTYSVAVYLNGSQVKPNAFSMVVSGYGGGTGPGGVIDDPEAASGPNGDVRGQQLVPGVNTVGAAYYGDSPAFGEAPTAAEYFSDSGPGQVLYDANGNALPAPVSAGKVNFAAPDGVNTAVPGFAGFYGTSAAAPDAAAVAALMLQANPNLTQAQVTSLLASSAIPFGRSQWAGAGLIQAQGAVQGAIAAIPTPTPNPAPGGGTPAPSGPMASTTPTPAPSPTPVSSPTPIPTSTPAPNPIPTPAPVPIDAVSISPTVSYANGVFTLTGTASSTAGVHGVEISALVDGTRQDLGAAAVNPDGSFTFQDAALDQQTFFVATLTDDASGTPATSTDPGFALTGGLGPQGRYGQQQSFSPTGEASMAVFRPNGQRFLSLEAPGQTVDLELNDIVANHHVGDNRFVFTPGDGVDVLGGYQASGRDTDTLALPSSEFKNFAAVLRDTSDVNGSALISDPKTGEGIYLQGTSVAQVRRNPREFTFYG